MMENTVPFPTIEDVERISKMDDPVMRNLQITQCYHELSAVLASRTGKAANWCTFATWASRQAGQTIRKEDLARMLERALTHSQSAMQSSRRVARAINSRGAMRQRSPQDLALKAGNFKSAIDRASDAVGRGNKKVFEEIGFEFARFYQTCFFDQTPDHQAITRFCEQLRAGEPPDGQDYLRQAFLHYAQALVETNLKTRAQFILLANVEIGLHEQTRLQPEIAESLDAGFIGFLAFTRPLFRSIFPLNGWFHLAHLYLKRLLGRPTVLDLAIRDLLAEARVELRRLITEMMMSIALPSGVVLRLGEDLANGFPESLRQINHPDLGRFLEKHDLTPDSLSGSGAVDWADLPDRLHFILDMFRCYQENQNMFEPPYTPEQVGALKGGRLPSGRL
jgi:hypothetical protein